MCVRVGVRVVTRACGVRGIGLSGVLVLGDLGLECRGGGSQRRSGLCAGRRVAAAGSIPSRERCATHLRAGLARVEGVGFRE